MRTLHRWTFAVLAAVALFAVAAIQGCDENEPSIVEPAHDHEVETLAVEPATLEIQEGETYRLTAIPACECGEVLDVAVEWVSSDPVVATVDADGLVTARAAGEVDIEARAQGKSGAVGGSSRVGVAAKGEGGNGGKGGIYAELVYLYRSVDGLPILREVAGETCRQPVSYTAVPDVDPVTNPVNGKDVWLLPLMGDETVAAAVTAAEEDEGEVEACDVQAAYVDYMNEVEIGRLNMGRSPDKVLDRALGEVYARLDAASALLLDHAGRLSPDDAPIDAPGENLAIQRELELYGQLDGYTLPDPAAYDHLFLDHASSALAAGADKFGQVNADLVVYFDRIMNFPQEVAGGMTTLTGDGTVGEEGMKYLDYGDFSYDRETTFPGCVTAFRLVGEEMVPFEGTLMDLVFGGEAFTADNIHGFAQRTDDARAVILFEHDNTIVSIDRIGETAVCEANEIE